MLAPKIRHSRRWLAESLTLVIKKPGPDEWVLRNVREELANVVNERDKARKELAAAAQELKTTYDRLKERTQERDSARKGLAKYTKRLAKVTGSLSWKLTVPLRAVDRAMDKLKEAFHASR
jgi:uncharacterized protein (DUF3084 family)